MSISAVTHPRAIRTARLAGLLAGLLVAAAPLAAQETGSIRGRVRVAATAQPLSGAQVTLAGSTRGGQTNDAGEYVITNVPAGTHEVRVKRIGYTPVSSSVTVAGGQAVTADFALREAPVALNEVVVTGTAIETRKREIGNATASINAAQIDDAPVRTPQEILSGRAAGVTVLSNSGQPGAGGTIRLRGNNSITQGNNPVIYVDGVRIYSENGPVALASRQNSLALNDIKAEDIERIEIVKGPAATTLYGTEASGGVIQIFTKKGSASAPVWNAELTTGFNNAGHIGPKEDPTGLFLNKCRGKELVDKDGKAFVDPTCPASGSWLQNGPVQRYSVAVRGGGDNMTYSLSGTYADEQGVIQTGWSKDGGVRGNFTFKPASSLDFALNSSYNRRIVRWVPDGNNGSGFLLNVGRGPFNNFKGGRGECATIPSSAATCVTNGYILSQRNFNHQDHYITGLTMSWTPIEGLTNRVVLGYDYNNADNQTVYPFGYLNAPLGFIWKQDWNHTKLTFDYTGSYLHSFGKLASTSSWGGQVFRDEEHYTRVNGDDFSGPGEPTLGSAARATVGGVDRLKVVNAGLFLQQMVGWDDRLFVTAGLRVDGNSSFGEDFGLQKYPKLSASWVLSDYGFWPTQWIETMKLRGAIGESGKAPGAFDAARTWDPIAGDDGTPGLTPAQRGNPTLGPERAREVEAGFDMSAFGGRIGLEFSGFRTRTYGALVGVTYPPSEGFLFDQLENVGTLENSGIEVGLDATLFNSERVDWRARLNVSATKSNTVELTDFGGKSITSIYTGLGSYVREGHPVPAYFGTRITNPNEFADPVLEEDAYIGPVYPTRVVGISTTLTLWKDLTLDALGEFQSGAFLANWVGYQNARRGIWVPCYGVQSKLRAALGTDGKKGTLDDKPEAIADVTALERGKCAIDRTVMNDNFWIQPSDFFKLRTVSMTYRVPERLVPVGRSMTVSFSGRNLLKSTDYDGTDPEVQDARDAGSGLGRRDYYNLPPVRTFLTSVRVTF